MLRLRNRINIVKHRLRHILNYLGLLVNSADVIHEGLSFFLLYIVGRDTLGSVGYFRDPHKAQIIAHKMLGSLFEGVLQRWTSCEAVTFCLILQAKPTDQCSVSSQHTGCLKASSSEQDGWKAATRSQTKSQIFSSSAAITPIKPGVWPRAQRHVRVFCSRRRCTIMEVNCLVRAHPALIVQNPRHTSN